MTSISLRSDPLLVLIGERKEIEVIGPPAVGVGIDFVEDSVQSCHQDSGLGMTASFMPKPIYGEAGSGMHVHIWLWKDGKPLFYDEKGYSQLSDTALYFIGGLLRHAASLCAITNPSTNSFKRLVPGFEAPVTIGYATANRSSIIRIPAYAKTPAQKRFELRNPDALCNPYYAYAAILMAGLDGILFPWLSPLQSVVTLELSRRGNTGNFLLLRPFDPDPIVDQLFRSPSLSPVTPTATYTRAWIS